jgi:serine/threonine-protein kinase
MRLSPGRRVGCYEILATLGAGGMGEVYRARDTRLHREVALKVLPESLIHDRDRLSRFAREAHLLASLNHPGIAQIYGIEDSEDVHALVLELVEGETLAERIKRGTIPLSETLAIVRQVASALAAAHDAGIIHRDLKPANVKITPDGVVKLLDFGLAKGTVEPSAAAANGEALTNSPTMTGPGAVTHVGVILGTAAYMSPEQAKGRVVDRRTDVWAVGVVMYEMVTGRPAFEGDDVQEVLARILMKEPDWSRLPSDTPPTIRKLIGRCLRKDRRQRLDSAKAVELEIDEALSVSDTAQVLTAPRRSWMLWGLVVALFVGALVSGFATWSLTRSPRDVSMLPVRFTIVPPPEHRLMLSQFQRSLAISPDGRYLAYLSGTGTLVGQAVLRRLDQLEARFINPAVEADEIFFSADSQWLGFIEAPGDIKKVAVSGGPIIPIAGNVGVAGGAGWADDNSIFFSTLDPASGLLRIPPGGSQPAVASRPDPGQNEIDHTTAMVLPGSRTVLTAIVLQGGQKLNVGALDLATSHVKSLLPGNTPTYVDIPTDRGASGFIVFGQDGALRAVRFDARRLELLGEPVTLIENVQTTRTGRTQYAVSRTGTLIYMPATPGAGSASLRSIVWMDRKGHETPINAPPRPYFDPVLSPDGRLVALSMGDEDIWIWDLRSETLRRLTFGLGISANPQWTPDGRSIIFSSTRDGRVNNIYKQPADGSGSAARLTVSTLQQFVQSITPDGGRLIGFEMRSGGSDIVSWPAAGGNEAAPETLVGTPAIEEDGRVSPDGRYLAYRSAETGRSELYVRPFPNVSGGRWQISTNGGANPRWAPNGREIFYLEPSGALMAVRVEANERTFSNGAPTKLFDAPSASGAGFTVHPDGQRFLMVKDAPRDPNAPVPQIVVVVGWFEELKSRLPTVQ